MPKKKRKNKKKDKPAQYIPEGWYEFPEHPKLNNVKTFKLSDDFMKYKADGGSLSPEGWNIRAMVVQGGRNCVECEKDVNNNRRTR